MKIFFQILKTFYLEIFLAVNISVFLYWYFLIGKNNVFSLDDFWHDFNYQELGFFNTHKYYYLNWEGSYIHTFFATIVHNNLFKNIFQLDAWFFILISFLVFSLSVFYFLKSIVPKLPKWKNILTSLYFVSILYAFTSSRYEILYWTCANLTYLSGLSFLILFLTNLFKKSQYGIKETIFSVILILLVVGNKLSVTALFFILVIFYWLFNLKELTVHKRFFLIISLIFGTAFLTLNVFAPGNFIRLNQNMTEVNNAFSILDIIIFKSSQVVFPAFSYSIVFLLPFSLILKNYVTIFEVKYILCIGLALLVYLIIESIFFWLAFRDPGPIRNNIFIETLTFAFSAGILIRISLDNLPLRFLTFIILVASIFYQSSFFKFIEPSKIYYEAYYDRYNLVKSSNSTIIDIKPLPYSGLIHSIGSNDEEWLNNVYLKCFNKGDNTRINLLNNEFTH